MDVVSEMVDAYVQAAQQIIMVATVNEMAQDAQEVSPISAKLWSCKSSWQLTT